jgi:hypothetical protein
VKQAGDFMEKFEYEITKHPSGEFRKLVYFCNEQGECKMDQVPADQLKAMGEILNSRGSQGWELVQLFFGDDGVVAFWKRAI